VTPEGEPFGDLSIDLRAFTGEDEQLLAPTTHRVVESTLDLLRCVQMGLVGRERAVLTEALAGPRQRQRVVA
jgi:hypothetical protein